MLFSLNPLKFRLDKVGVFYEPFCFDVAQSRINSAPNETQTHPRRLSRHYTTQDVQVCIKFGIIINPQ